MSHELRSAVAPPPRAGGCLLAACAIGLLTGGNALIFAGIGVATDPTANTPTNRYWGLSAIVCGAALSSGALCVLLLLKLRQLWTGCVSLLGAGMAAAAVTVWFGTVMIKEARMRGGDFGALSVATAQAATFVPALLAVTAIVAILALMKMRPAKQHQSVEFLC